jgi:hypothetical protein
MMPQAWRKDALCLGAVTADYDPFTPDIDKGRKLAPAVKDGLKYCENCPVKQQCAQAALDQGPDVYGLWAGVALTGYRDKGRLREIQIIAAGGGEPEPARCHAPGCDRTDLKAKGYCRSHYRVHQRGGEVGALSREGMAQRRQEWLTLVSELRSQGLNDEQLAEYFRVKPESFQRRLERYRALDNPAPRLRSVS